jgi:tRNA(Ile)-lysidine synthase
MLVPPESGAGVSPAGGQDARPILGIAPIGDDEFAAFMARLGGFEPAPALAIAVSGGADSLALLLLADHWARARGGTVTALTVDHRLRAEAAAEAARVARWAEARGIAHRTLVWPGPYPAGAVQAAARDARYRLLGEWCRGHGVLHLLTAHHQDDQAETLLLRLARGSGLAGLAGMAPIVEERHWRLVRPLLDLPPARLRASLEAAAQDWIEDPSNRDPRFARARLRGERAALATAGLTPPRLAETCRHLGRARMALESVIDRLLLDAVVLDPAGFALVDLAPLARAAPEIRLRTLAALIMTIGGEPYAPRFERLERLAEAIFGIRLAGGRTLGGCRILQHRDRLLILRELAATAPPAPLPDVGALLWDNRFLVEGGAGGLEIGALGRDGVAALRAIAPDLAASHLPRSAWPTLPVLRRDGTLVAVPHLGWRRSGSAGDVALRWRPARSICARGFTVV